MNFYIQKLKISHFLSFFNEYEVSFKPFTGILCNYYEGKDDFFRSFEFVFGAELSDLRVENCVHLVHKVLREKFLISGHSIKSFVEITIYFPNENKHLTFRRSIINRNGQAHIEHNLGNTITTGVQYKEKLNSFGLYVKQKNLIFYNNYFDYGVWNSSEDLEKIISICLRKNYLAEEWKKIEEKLKYLTKLKNYEAEKNYNSIKTGHFLIAKYIDKYKNVLSDREKVNRIILKNMHDISSDISSASNTSDLEEPEKYTDFENDPQKICDLELKNEYLETKLQNLKLKEAELTSRIYYEEIKMSAAPVDIRVVQNRISELKNNIKEKEKKLAEIWEKVNLIEKEVQNLSDKITITTISILEIQTKVFLRDCYTKYGRFSDHIQPCSYNEILKEIIGSEIFNGHFCDSFKSALSSLELLKNSNNREVIIPFDCYSHKLKDLIIASGEKGVEINTTEELLLFLCKLKHYGLINNVPIVVQKNFDFEKDLPKGNIFYVKDGLRITEDGLITYKYEPKTFNVETETDLRKNLIKFQTDEEEKYQEMNELFFQKYETLSEMTSLENDLAYIKRNWRKSNQTKYSQTVAFEVPDLYKDHSEIFNRYFEEYKNLEQEMQESQELMITHASSSLQSSTTPADESLQSFVSSLSEIQQQIIDVKEDLKNIHFEIRSFYKGPFWNIKVRSRSMVCSVNLDKSRMFLEWKFKKLKKSLTLDDFELFMSVQGLRKTAINSLLKSFEEIKKKLNDSIESFKNISTERKRKIDSLIQHVNYYLPIILRDIINNEVPSVNLCWSPEEEKIYLKSFIKNNGTPVEINHLNTFLKFLLILSLFLEIAVFEKSPIAIFDDMESYFPLQDADVETALCEAAFQLNNQNPRHSLLMEVGKFLEHYTKKNESNGSITNNGKDKDEINGPIQIIFLAKEDLILSASHFIWIHHQVLPEEFLTEDCNAYSQIHELNFDFFNSLSASDTSEPNV